MPDVGNQKVLLKSAMKVLGSRFPGVTFERLLCRPRDAMRFCQAVKQDMGGVNGFSSEEMLWSLLNLRKQGYLRMEDIQHAH
jgi:hypothetical protein